ncbi:MAG: hypothetical protein ACFFAN_04115 [Promethearchaeota archaeon]
MEKRIDWIFNLKEQIPLFLHKLKGRKRRGFYHYTLTGDYFGEKIKWGLGNSVFFLKIIYTLGLERKFKQEIKEAINFIQSFQKKDGSFYDPIVMLSSLPLRVLNAMKALDFKNFLNKENKRAETRQSLSALSLFGVKPRFEYREFPSNEKQIEKFLKCLNWEFPWGAGSHLSHLLFLLQYSSLPAKNKLIDFVIKWINYLQNEHDGFWYRGSPSIQQKINGAMKIMTGLKAVNRLDFNYPEKIIDGVLEAKNDKQACDNFNIIYVLKYCNELTDRNYRYTEIKDFSYQRLDIYKKYYFPKIGGFSFNLNKSNNCYYGAFIAKGKNEPDIHGTIMFLWGISIIFQMLELNEDLQFREHLT